MGTRTNYLKVIIDITDKASKTYNKYQEYKVDPANFSLRDPKLFFTFKTADSFLKTAKGYIGSNRKNINENTPITNIAKCYEILECNYRDTNDAIKASYKKLVKEYHPDIIAGKDLPKGFSEFASHRFKEIHSAYETVKKERRL